MSTKRSVEQYIQAATRDNTRKSYRAAIEHFEVNWGGLLPTNADQVSQYLVDYAQSLSHNTLKQRLAALSQWHITQGFIDPTKDPVIKKVMRGIRELHPAREKQARPLQLDVLGNVIAYLESPAESGITETATMAESKRRIRDKAILLTGFWRGFRTDELSRIVIEHVTINPGKSVSIYLPRSKTDLGQGREYQTPALQKLCPVKALNDWLDCMGKNSGPLFQKISSTGTLSGDQLNPGSLIPIIRKRLQQAGIEDSAAYSGHSLRRGFATWANSQGWSQTDLMRYVGWADPRSAQRYIEGNGTFHLS